MGRARALFDARRLGHRVEILLRQLGVEPEAQLPATAALRLFLGMEVWHLRPREASTAQRLEGWLGDPEVRRFLAVHDFDGVSWFRQEGFRTFLWWLVATTAVELRPWEAPPDGGDGEQAWESCRATVGALLDAEGPSGYRLRELMAAVSCAGPKSAGRVE